jgi:hypothetical protein
MFAGGFDDDHIHHQADIINTAPNNAAAEVLKLRVGRWALNVF